MALQFAAQFGVVGGELFSTADTIQYVAEDRQLAAQQLLVQFDEVCLAGAAENEAGQQRHGGGAGGEQQAQAQAEGEAGTHASRSSST